MTDKKFTVTEESTSKHPHDWGRAMAVAISRLTDLAREAGDPVHDEALIGEELQLFVEDTEHGVNITMAWTPGEQGPRREAPTQPPAGQGIDPTGGSTAGLGQ
ncbi:hypothetical protein [Arthrobacter sp. Ld5]|uniref:hypothetical protein n=1 Tax=Arthrobacter sp. Ld5 TaxID=649152 RepID=UPI003EB84C23